MTSSYWLDEVWKRPARGVPWTCRSSAAGSPAAPAHSLSPRRAGGSVSTRHARSQAGRVEGMAASPFVEQPWRTTRPASSLGRRAARALWGLTERYLERLTELAGGAFRRTGSLRLAADPNERAELEREHLALREDGFAVEWRDELPEPLAGRFDGAIVHPGDGSLQPARWVRRLAERAAAAGVEVRERDRVESLEELESDQIVLATDGYTSGLAPDLDEAVRPVRGQVVVTEPPRRGLFPCPHY